MKFCLIVVDAQKGFTALCPKELPVPGGVDIVPKINELLDLPFSRKDATQDWHPPNHCSFIGHQDNLYPPHCVAGTEGSEFLPGLNINAFHRTWRKGFEKDHEAYSIVAQYPAYPLLLKGEGITHVFVCGIATNICVLQTAIDLTGRQLVGWSATGPLEVYIIEDASAGIDVGQFNQVKNKEVGQNTFGIKYVNVNDVVKLLSE